MEKEGGQGIAIRAEWGGRGGGKKLVMSKLILELVYKCGSKNQGLNNNQNSHLVMQQDSYQPDNSASLNNNPNNPAPDTPLNTFKVELTPAQASYLARLLPTSYSFQLDSKTTRRLPSSKPKEDLRPPPEPKRKPTKDDPKPPAALKNTASRGQRSNNKYSEEIQNAVYQKYNAQKQVARRNSYEGLAESLKPCIRILNLLKNSRTSWLFREPVDPIALGIPHYTEIVKEPMDLSTVQNNLRTNQYITPTQFHADISKIITNSYIFNSSDIEITRLTSEFQSYYRRITAEPQPLQRGYSQTDLPTELYPSKSIVEKKTKKQSKDSEGTHANTVISMAEKKELGLNIKKLPKEHMKGILDIVNEGKVKTVGQFDLKELDAIVIRKLQHYVKEKLSGEAKNKSGFGHQKAKESRDKEESSFELEEEDQS